MSRPSWLIIGALLAVPAAALSDEAVRGDGTRSTGRLTLDTKCFHFDSAGRPVAIADLDLVRFKLSEPAVVVAPLWHRVRLPHGEAITGEVQRLDATHLYVRTAWAESLMIPRAFVERVANLPGWQPVLFEPFTGDLTAWKTSGEPRTVDGNLLINRAGQTLEASLKRSLTTGRVAVGFRAGRTTARTLILELAFRRGGKLATVRIELAGPGESYSMTSPAKPKYSPSIKRDREPHRVSVEFDPEGLSVFVDGLVLWSQQESPGELLSLKILANGAGTEAVSIGDVLVARPEAIGGPKSWADLTSDALRSPEGDETFGAVVAAGSAGVVLEVKGRKTTHLWPQIAEFAFRRGGLTERATEGEQVQIRVRSGEGTRDVLEGAVTSFDDKRLVLNHPLLGELAIPRDRLEEIRFRFFGRQLPVETAPHHLGAKPAFGFAVPKPEGLSMKKTVRQELPPTGGFIVVDAARLNPAGTPLEVLLNGESLGELNRQADRPDGLVHSYRLPLPTRLEKAIEIELRLKPGKDGRRITSVDVRAVRLELREAR